LESASPAMARALATARQAAASDATLLLTGESGTGKNVLAAAMHAWSPRHAGPFVTISCTSLAEHLLESELFGHMKGAFTSAWKDKPGRLEAARGGTIFLDEVGDLPPELQGKLLRFLEEHRFERVGGSETIEVDARVVAAAYPWPGNVRELVNTLERAVVLSRGDTIRAEDLPDRLLEPPPAAPATPEAGLSLEDVERRHIVQVLAESSTLEDAAARLGINV